ncbi:MAG: hypothetical protein OES18_25330 [Deltaproteobacteria bacterium]|nr:hypothetical protein [Deltaproteobacteria bacterium]
MAVLPGVLGCSFDRLRTGSSCDVSFRYGNQHPAVARWPTHLRGLATAIHKISGLEIANKVVMGGRGRGMNTII